MCVPPHLHSTTPFSIPIRDAVGLLPSPFSAAAAAIYFTENGRDNMKVLPSRHIQQLLFSSVFTRTQGPLGFSHTPPEELNRVAITDAPAPASTANFGFPFCYG